VSMLMRQPIQPEAATPVESLWTPRDLASYLKVSVRMVQRMASAGQLPKPVYVGRLPRWNAAVVQAYVERGGK
jgi:excisionase family DNA binding protein